MADDLQPRLLAESLNHGLTKHTKQSHQIRDIHEKVRRLPNIVLQLACSVPATSPRIE